MVDVGMLQCHSPLAQDKVWQWYLLAPFYDELRVFLRKIEIIRESLIIRISRNHNFTIL